MHKVKALFASFIILKRTIGRSSLFSGQITVSIGSSPTLFQRCLYQIFFFSSFTLSIFSSVLKGTIKPNIIRTLWGFGIGLALCLFDIGERGDAHEPLKFSSWPHYKKITIIFFLWRHILPICKWIPPRPRTCVISVMWNWTFCFETASCWQMLWQHFGL